MSAVVGRLVVVAVTWTLSLTCEPPSGGLKCAEYGVRAAVHPVAFARENLIWGCSPGDKKPRDRRFQKEQEACQDFGTCRWESL